MESTLVRENVGGRRGMEAPKTACTNSTMWRLLCQCHRPGWELPRRAISQNLYCTVLETTFVHLLNTSLETKQIIHTQSSFCEECREEPANGAACQPTHQ